MNLLKELSDSCITVMDALPSSASLLPESAGVSLLDLKSELFLSYLQGLALRNLSIIRSIKSGHSFETSRNLSDQLTKKLVEQRLYLEKGVRPLEHRIKYQIDKVIRATDDHERLESQRRQRIEKMQKSAEEEDAEEDHSSNGEDQEEIDELSYRPNPSAFKHPTMTNNQPSRQRENEEDGIYRPPRISAAVMPDIDKREKRERKPNKSSTLDEYVEHELSTAPMAEPSIGSTILAGGRQSKTARDLASEAERQDYEETHLVRLPTISQKEKARQARNRNVFEEDLQGFGDSLNRISDLTRKSKTNVLEKSRKRRAVEDGPRSDGIGSAFNARRKQIGKRIKR